MNKVKIFTYLGLVVHEDGNNVRNVANRIRRGRTKWRRATGVLCDKKKKKVKEKLCKTVVRLATMYGPVCRIKKRK